MKIEIIKRLRHMEVVRLYNRRGPSKESIFRIVDYPDMIGVRRRGAPDREESVQGPFETLQAAIDSARSQDDHLAQA